MKHVERCLTAALAAILFLTACSGSDTPEVAVPTPVIGEPEPTAAPTTEPAPTPLPDATPVPTAAPLTDDELIAMATAAFDADPSPPEIIAFDVLEATVREDGAVELRLCTWDGSTVFNEVRQAVYRIAADAGDEPVAELVTGAKAAGDCLNHDMMQSVLAFSRDFDSFFGEALADPGAFAEDPRSRTLLTDQAFEATSVLLGNNAQDQIQTLFTDHDLALPDAAIADIMWRRYDAGGRELFGLVACRPMNPDYGFYRDDVLLDDTRGDSTGDHAIAEYIVARAPGEEPAWQLQELTGRFWADCFRTGDWPAAVNQWRPEPVGWQPWTR